MRFFLGARRAAAMAAAEAVCTNCAQANALGELLDHHSNSRCGWGTYQRRLRITVVDTQNLATSFRRGKRCSHIIFSSAGLRPWGRERPTFKFREKHSRFARTGSRNSFPNRPAFSFELCFDSSHQHG